MQILCLHGIFLGAGKHVVNFSHCPISGIFLAPYARGKRRTHDMRSDVSFYSIASHGKRLPSPISSLQVKNYVSPKTIDPHTY